MLSTSLSVSIGRGGRMCRELRPLALASIAATTCSHLAAAFHFHFSFKSKPDTTFHFGISLLDQQERLLLRPTNTDLPTTAISQHILTLLTASQDMAPQTLTHLLVGLMIATSSQVNANWSITFYESFDKCTGKDPNRNHYYTFSGDPNQSSATLRSECFIPGGDRVQQGIDTNMICAETVDGGATMQQCTPWSMPLKLKSWSWSLTAGSTCSWGAVRPYVDQQGICLGFTSAPTGDSVCYSSEHEVHVHGQDAPTMSFTCRCSDACKPKYLVGRVEEVANDTAMGEEEEDAAAVKDKQDILTGCKMM